MNIVEGLSFDVSSDYVSATSVFTGTDETIVYVESFKDISFWTELFHRNNFERKIRVVEVSRDCKANGKDVILFLFRSGSLKLGKSLLVALDSDYDYLLNENSDVYTQEFCFQTYCYSIENFYYDPSHSLFHCCRAANCFEFEDELTCLSAVFAEWSKNNIEHFLSFLTNRDRNDILTVYQSLDALTINCQKSTKADLEISPEFSEKGLSNVNLFYFIRGHNIESKCNELLDNIFHQITLKKKSQINKNSNHSPETKVQLISQFCQSRTPIKSILYTRDISVNPFFEKINSDIELFKNRFC